MRTSRHQRNVSQEWLALAVAVGLSLTLLFFSQHRGVMSLRTEMSDVISSVSQPFSKAGNVVNTWGDYDNLRVWAMELSLENNMLRDAILENERLRALLDFKQRSPLDLMPAAVIARVSTGIAGRLRLNIGAVDGVEINSAVMTPRGLVGKVTEVSSRTCLVQTLVGNSYGVSVMVERTRLTGIMRFQARDEWVILGLPSGSDVLKGDVLITSGSGSVFPKGIRTAIVTGVTPSDTPYGQTWAVEPVVDFGTVEEVFVVIRSPYNDAVMDVQESDSSMRR